MGGFTRPSSLGRQRPDPGAPGPRLSDVKIGLMLPQGPDDGAGATWPEILAVAREAEAGGADSLWLSDHFFYRGPSTTVGGEVGGHEAWSLLSALATATTRVELGTLVLATSFRPAGLLAKMAATVDRISDGRLTLGLGCGWHQPEYDAFGYPFDHRVSRFAEDVEIVTRLLRGERVSFDGQWNHLRDAAIVPPPPRSNLPVLVAATGERMMRLTARFADAWQTAWFGRPDDRFRSRRDAFFAACEAEARDPDTIDVTVGVSVNAEPAESGLPLNAAAIADGLAEWSEAGVDHVMVGLDRSTRETFAVVLAAVEAVRGDAASPDEAR
jgi:probable F420-dependent oxidoreductase